MSPPEQSLFLELAQITANGREGRRVLVDLRVGPVVEGVLHVRRSHWLAVGEGDAAADVERVGLATVGDLPLIRDRRDYRAAFEARLHGTAETLAFSGMTRNISASGMLCETRTALNPDDLLNDLNFSLDSNEILTNGRVVWSAAGQDDLQHYGVQFMDLAPELRERIERFVAPRTAAETC